MYRVFSQDGVEVQLREPESVGTCFRGPEGHDPIRGIGMGSQTGDTGV